MMQWSLLPYGLKQDPKLFATNTLNTKSETLAEKASFKHLIASKRCIIPSTVFFEYQTNGKEKIPYFIYSKDEPLFPWRVYTTLGSIHLQVLQFPPLASSRVVQIRYLQKFTIRKKNACNFTWKDSRILDTRG